ncbi:MAG: hypothetical protein ABIP94_20560 [Planctomycetota bacterium]
MSRFSHPADGGARRHATIGRSLHLSLERPALGELHDEEHGAVTAVTAVDDLADVGVIQQSQRAHIFAKAHHTGVIRLGARLENFDGDATLLIQDPVVPLIDNPEATRRELPAQMKAATYYSLATRQAELRLGLIRV